MNSFNLYEDVLSRTWNRYYYEVEAETLEEAIEKVKDGEVLKERELDTSFRL